MAKKKIVSASLDADPWASFMLGSVNISRDDLLKNNVYFIERHWPVERKHNRIRRGLQLIKALLNRECKEEDPIDQR